MNTSLPSPAILETVNGNFITHDVPWRMDEKLAITDRNTLGSICISSRILFEKCIVPRLNPIVKKTHVNLKSCKTEVGNDNEFQWDLNFDGDPKFPNSDDKYYEMKPMLGDDKMWRERTWFGGEGDNSGDCQNIWGYRFIMEKTAHLESRSDSTLRDIRMGLDGICLLHLATVCCSTDHCQHGLCAT